MDWSKVSLTLLTPVITLIGLAIAFQQMKINRNRLRHELFEKRFRIFKDAGIFLGSIMQEGKATIEAQGNYRSGIQGSSFLFDKKVSNLLDYIWHQAINLEAKQFEIKDLPVGQERSKLAGEIRELKTSLFDQFKPLETEFSRFLDLSDLK